MDRNNLIEFLKCYERNRPLWDITSPDYTYREIRLRCYNELLKILKRDNSDATIADVKRKINSLRCSYKRELKNLETPGTCKSTVWWFHLMDFIRQRDNTSGATKCMAPSMDSSRTENETVEIFEVKILLNFIYHLSELCTTYIEKFLNFFSAPKMRKF